ncbi:hypothetical protein B0H17DRAFT_1209365 [Mycena rosella]|uniref:Uncharacterized protein n=1 Tax=Mycena rosella TaxID=1033263 RepID=A0AAD7CZ18_MYCRO|nr:hypothetical protein B0H17DRAFT_1209365 [Mycena rosella]
MFTVSPASPRQPQHPPAFNGIQNIDLNAPFGTLTRTHSESPQHPFSDIPPVLPTLPPSSQMIDPSAGFNLLDPPNLMYLAPFIIIVIFIVIFIIYRFTLMPTRTAPPHGSAFADLNDALARRIILSDGINPLFTLTLTP